MSWNPETPYNDLPIPPPDLERVETRNVLNACISARAAIAKLKTVSELIPYQRVLINILPMLETKDSSRIENIITTSDQLFNMLTAQVVQIQPRKKHCAIVRRFMTVISTLRHISSVKTPR